MYTDDEGLEKSMNIKFTSLHIINPFIEINKGRCDFLYDDIIMLTEEAQKILARIKC